MENESSCTAFEGEREIASGPRRDVALAVKAALDGRDASQRGILIFDDRTGRQVELDVRGSDAAVTSRYAAAAGTDGPAAATAPRSPGRPRLGVVAREVTLLPRHWEWLADQPGGASVTLRKLVDAARAAGRGPERVRQSREAADRFMAATLGNRPGYEEASRALYRGDARAFRRAVRAWPRDLRDHAARLAAPSFAPIPADESPDRQRV